MRSDELSYEFFSLPPELRLKIYSFLMGAAEGETYKHIHIESMISNDCQGRIIPKRRCGQMLRTCRKVYHEALPILYGSHILNAKSYEKLAEGLGSIGTNAHAVIRDIIITKLDMPSFLPNKTFLSLDAES
jgi:hypothetical protein